MKKEDYAISFSDLSASLGSLPYNISIKDLEANQVFHLNNVTDRKNMCYGVGFTEEEAGLSQ